MSPDSESSREWPLGHVGYVGLIGRPNTGKSTFLNTVLDFHLSAVSRQPQTTRRHALGILSDATSQILFLDAPGIHQPRNRLGDAMVAAIGRTLAEADVLLCIADPTRPPGEEDTLVAQRLSAGGRTVLLGINKADLGEDGQIAATRAFYQQFLGSVPTYVFSARDRGSLDPVLAAIRRCLPKGPFLYSPDDITDDYVRNIAAERIREICFETLRQEVPHALAVTVDGWEEERTGTTIQATVHVERTSQKKIVVGRDGRMVKQLQRRAQQALQDLCPQGVSLRLWVKVSRDWRSKTGLLRDLGLLGEP